MNGRTRPHFDTATFSPCRRWRYSLWRIVDLNPDAPFAMFVGLNPSTADERADDPTVRRCINFAKSWGYGALLMTNAFAFRATDPRVMLAETDPVGPDNDDVLRCWGARAGVVVAAWGAHGVHQGRDAKVRALIPDLHYLRLTKDGQPGHPLYLPSSLTPTLW